MGHDPGALRGFCLKLAGLIGLFVGSAAMTYIVIGKWLLEVWLRNTEAVTAIYPILSVLLVGTVLNAFYNVGYVNWLARKKVYMILRVNAFALILSVLLIPLLVSWQGTIGAAFGWLVINLIGLAFRLGWVKRLPNERSD